MIHKVRKRAHKFKEGFMIVNLTPHAIRLIACGTEVLIPASGREARVDSESTLVDTIVIEGIPFPVSRTTYGAVTGLPEAWEFPGTTYIVSGKVLGQCSGRRDVIGPNTGSTAVRKDGQIWGVVGVEAAPL